MIRRSRIPAFAAALGMAVSAATAAAPKFRVAGHILLDGQTEPPEFVCLDSPMLLDRGRLVHVGRPREYRNAFTIWDLKTFDVRELKVPDLPADQVAPKDQLALDRPLFYDRENAVAGLLLRGGGLVTGDAAFAEWDLKANRVVRRLPLGGMDGAGWMSVAPVGYDPARREAYVEIVRYGVRLKTSPNRGGHYDVEVLGVTDSVRKIAAFTTGLKMTSQGPYWDPVHRRSFHVEYAEYAGTISTGTLVDLDTGAITQFPLPPLIYGWAFDPDGKTGYGYSERLGEVFAVDLATGAIGRKVKTGRKGHVLGFVAPGLLFLGRNGGMHFLETARLRQKWLLSPKAIYAPADHLEGSLVLPGRVLMRNYENFYALDFPALTGPAMVR